VLHSCRGGRSGERVGQAVSLEGDDGVIIELAPEPKRS
jgi:hypothetical protein